MHSDVEDLIDADSWRSLDPRASSALLAGTATFAARPAMVVGSRYDIEAGTFGTDEVARLVGAITRATEARLPLVSLLQSGGVRLTEGVPPFLALREVVRALRAHRRSGLVHAAHLLDPSMGGVLATWGATADVITAAPGARIALTGPGAGVDVITAERVLGAGLIDGIVPIGDLRIRICTLLEILDERNRSWPVDPTEVPQSVSASAGWAAVLASRRPERLGVGDLLDNGLHRRFVLSGDRSGGNDPNVLTAIGTFAGRSCMVIASAARSPMDRTGPTASGLRTARRAMGLADRLGLPVVSLVDVAGPGDDGPEMAYEVGRCIDVLDGLRVPSVGVLVGEGGGGVALALLAATSVLALEDAWLAPLVPERAAAVLHLRGGAAEYADTNGIGAADLAARGAVDEVVPRDSRIVLGRIADHIERQRRRSGMATTRLTPSPA